MSLSLAYVQEALLITATDDMITNAATVGINAGIVGALNTPENLSHAKMTRLANNNGSGHIREVRIATKQRLTPSDNEDLEMDGCDFGDEIPYIEETVSITKQSAVSFTIAEETIRRFPEVVSQLVTLTGAKSANQIVMKARQSAAGMDLLRVIREMAGDFLLSYDALIQKINIQLLTDFVALQGAWQGGDATKSYEVQYANGFATGGGAINAGGLFQFKQDARNNMFPGTPHVIVDPHGAMDRIYQSDSRYFGQGANGINYSSVRGDLGQIARIFPDQNIADVVGDVDDALIFMPGSANFLPWLKYVGSYGDIGIMDRFTLPIPQVPNLDVDVKILPDECEEIYKVKMGLHYELYIPTLELFKATDYLYGVNGTFPAAFTQA